MRGDCGPATTASLSYPRGIAKYTDQDGVDYLFIADSGNNRVRKVELTNFPRCVQLCGRLNCGVENTLTEVEYKAATVDECAFECGAKLGGHLCSGWSYRSSA